MIFMDKNFRPYYLVSKTDKGLVMQFFDSLSVLYNHALSDSSIISYSVFRTIDIKSDF